MRSPAVLAALVIFLTLMGSDVQAVGPGPEPQVSEAVAGALDRVMSASERSLFQTTRIYDRHGNLLHEIIDEGRRTIVSLDEAPDYLIQATIATEDKNFYRHTGVDWEAVARSAYMNWQADGIVSGASTITQQLARSLLMEETARYDVSLQRKMREAMVSLDIEEAFSKDQILEAYLNTVFYGHRAYGVKAAAKTYFNKELSELTLAESALIAGIPQSPNYLDPFVNPAAARTRMRVVLSLMERQGYITAAEKQAALAEPLRLTPPEFPQPETPHFVDYIRELLLERYGEQGMRSGLHVYTSIDPRYQKLAEKIARAQISNIGAQYNASNASVVIIHPPTGEILAMVGSLDYFDETIDGQVNMTIHRRQPGSSIKPIVYATAFDQGFSPASVIWDTFVLYPNPPEGWYTPTNITNRYYGAARLRTALSNSLNVSAVKLLDQVGIEQVLASAGALGIRSWKQPPDYYGLSLAVGGYEVSLLELTHAFSTLANNGEFIPLHPVTEIQDVAGRVLYQRPDAQPPQYAVSPAAAYQVSSVLSDNRSRQMVFGQNSALVTSQPAAAKTGTTDDWRDNLTVGYTPYLAVGVWVGNSDGFTMRKSLGSTTAAPIWHDIMEAVWAAPELHDSLGYAGQPLPQGFTPPADIVMMQVCEMQPGKFKSGCPLAYEEVLVETSQLGIVSQAAELQGGQRGYCLIPLPGDGSDTLRQQAAFVPLPEDDPDRKSAKNWASQYGLRLTTLSECSVTPVERRVAQQPQPSAPKRLIELPEPVDKVAPEDAGNLLLPGTQAGVINKVGVINMYSDANRRSKQVGNSHPGDTLAIRKGPNVAGGIAWFEVRNLDRGNIGWVEGQSLYPDNPAVDVEAAAAGKLLIGSRASLVPWIDSLYVRSKPGTKSAVVGYIRPKHVVIIQQGPQKAGRGRWYEVIVDDKNLHGWVDGRFLLPRYY